MKDKEINETKQIKIPARAIRRHKTMIRVARGWMALAKNNWNFFLHLLKN